MGCLGSVLIEVAAALFSAFSAPTDDAERRRRVRFSRWAALGLAVVAAILLVAALVNR